MSKKKWISIPIIALIAGFFVAADCVLFQSKISALVTGYLCPPKSTTVDSDDHSVAYQIQEEGTVMVKNDGVLPLNKEKVTKVNVFGRASVDWLYSGSGSGQVQQENLSLDNLSFLDALSEYGVEYNTDLSAMYKSYLYPKGYGNSLAGGKYYGIADPSIKDEQYYTADLLSQAKAYSDTALVVIGRRSGEGLDATKYQVKWKGDTDETRHYLEISTEEEELLTYVGENYENVIVVINSTNVMELGFLDSIKGIDSCLVVGTTGTRSAKVIPEILYGEKGPSGRLADTYAYSLKDNVNYNHTGYDSVTFYEGGEGLYPAGKSVITMNEVPTGAYYTDYVEGIYVGYKWYETADTEGVWEGRTRQCYADDGSTQTKKDYDAVVQFPFGYGLSYNQFSWELKNVKVDGSANLDNASFTKDSVISFTVRVTNKSGDLAAKDVVQIYSNPPYTKGGIEKASVNLVGFAKTGYINPGRYEDVTVDVALSDLASYDCYDKNQDSFKGYELDQGLYELSLRKNAHEVFSDPVTFTLPETIRIEKDQQTGTEVKNRFTGEDAIDGVSIDGLGEQGGNQNIEYISRASFPKSTPEVAKARTCPQIVKDTNLFTAADALEWNNATVDEEGNPVDTTEVKWNQDNGLKLYDSVSGMTMLGEHLGDPLNYNSEDWDSLLDQLDRAKAVKAIGTGSTGTAEITEIGKPALYDKDGPNQIGGFVSVNKRGIGYSNATVRGQTWNPELMFDFGRDFGKGMIKCKMNGVFGFGVNIHRSPFCGRNYEYFSEDGFLSGKLCAQAVYGLKTQGRYCFLKHFAVQETETGRDGIYTWLSEQALREIYLTPFRITVEEGQCNGFMSSYNRLGAIWTGGSYGLLTSCLRKEWGFKGSVITDFSDHNEYMNMNQAIRKGGDIGMSAPLTKDYDNTGVRMDHQIRQAIKDTTYMWLNAQYTALSYSEDYDSGNIYGDPWVWWIPLVIDLNILAGAGCLVWIYFLFRKPEEKQGGENHEQA